MHVVVAAAFAIAAWALYCRSQYKTEFRCLLEGNRSNTLYILSWIAALAAFVILIYPFLLL